MEWTVFREHQETEEHKDLTGLTELTDPKVKRESKVSVPEEKKEIVVSKDPWDLKGNGAHRVTKDRKENRTLRSRRAQQVPRVQRVRLDLRGRRVSLELVVQEERSDCVENVVKPEVERREREEKLDPEENVVKRER